MKKADFWNLIDEVNQLCPIGERLFHSDSKTGQREAQEMPVFLFGLFLLKAITLGKEKL